MIGEVLEGDQEFGVVLIERGSETGGGDVRSNVGTVAQVLQARELVAGQWAIVAVGTRRFRVERWHNDNPYPCAEVRDWPDPVDRPPVSKESVDARLHQLRGVLSIAASLGHTVGSTDDIGTDPVLAGYQIATLAPLGSFDRQRLLSAVSVTERFEMLEGFLSEQELLLLAEYDR